MATEGVRYKDKVTIVTGGSQGLGQGCVEVFGSLFYSVAIMLTLACMPSTVCSLTIRNACVYCFCLLSVHSFVPLLNLVN